MNLTITARKFKARENLKETIRNEVEKLNKFSDNILDVEVILSFQNSQDSIKIAEIIVNIPGHTLKSVEESNEFETSVHKANEKIISQLKKIKSKKIAAKTQDRE